MERACLLRPGLPVRPSDLPRGLQGGARTPRPTGSPSSVTDAANTIQVSLDQSLEDSMHQILLAALEAEGGNRSRAAKRLGVSLRTVQRHMTRR